MKATISDRAVLKFCKRKAFEKLAQMELGTKEYDKAVKYYIECSKNLKELKD